MSHRPQPPSDPEEPEGFSLRVQEAPSEWLLYLRNSNGYISALEGDIVSKDTELIALRTAVAEAKAVIRYQKEQLQEERDLSRRLEAEKIHLTNVVAPTVQTPPTELSPRPEPAAEAPIDHAPRTPAPPPAPRSEPISLSEKIPDPKEFDGTRSDLRRFVQQVHSKMVSNADRFPSAVSRLNYVASRLSGKAYDLILPRIQYGIPQFLDYTNMLSYLEEAFGDPDRKQNAENKLYNLKQRHLDFSVFFAEFERLALESEVPEAALPPLLSQGVSREIQDMLLHNPAPTREYRAFARHLQTLDNRFRQHQRQVNGPKGTTRSNNPASPHAPPGASPASLP